MSRLRAAFALIALLAASGQAFAAPPTVTPSPGYDARLQEQHKAASTASVADPVAPAPQHRKRHTRRTTTH